MAKDSLIELMKEHEKERFKELAKFAKELGFKKKGSNILLPFGEIDGIEYGICMKTELSKGVIPGAELPVVREFVYPYIIQNGKVKTKYALLCYAYEFVIRTAEVGDDRYIIEKKKAEQKERLDQARALMYAVKFKDLGTIDPSLMKDFYHNLLHLLSKDKIAKLVDSRLSELDEKFEEAEALASALPKDDIIDIQNNIGDEWEVLYELSYEFSGRAEKEYNIAKDNLVELIGEDLRKMFASDIWSLIDEEHDKWLLQSEPDE